MTWAKTWTPPPKLRDMDREPQRLTRVPSFGGSVSGEAVEKTKPNRCPALLEMANGRECLLCAPGRCSCTPGSVVACHSNRSIHGKAKGRKANDQFSVWGGDKAHAWLDAGGASKAAKDAAFQMAHLRQVLEWRRIATDLQEPERFRAAARWALNQLNATPIGETP